MISKQKLRSYILVSTDFSYTTSYKLSIVTFVLGRIIYIVYIMRLHDDSSIAMWSTAGHLLFTMTSKMSKLVTRLMSGWGGNGNDAVHLGDVEKTIFSSCRS